MSQLLQRKCLCLLVAAVALSLGAQHFSAFIMPWQGYRGKDVGQTGVGMEERELKTTTPSCLQVYLPSSESLRTHYVPSIYREVWVLPYPSQRHEPLFPGYQMRKLKLEEGKQSYQQDVNTRLTALVPRHPQG